MRRRILKIKPTIGELDFEDSEPITLVLDASGGLTTSKKGDYIEEKWKREKKERVCQTAHSCRREVKEDYCIIPDYQR